MANTRTLAETDRSPIDGSESVRLATTGANWRTTLAAIFKALSPNAISGRLTLASGVTVMASDVTGATTIYYTPYNGNVIKVWNLTGVGFQNYSFSELSNITTNSSTGNAGPAAVAANKNYDLFVWLNGSTLTLTRGPAWSTDTSRGTGAGTTELSLVEGLRVNAQTITNGPGATLGTYVGSVRSNGSSQIDWKIGSFASGTQEAILGVWNMHNRVDCAAHVADSTSSWTYSGSTWRSANNTTQNRISILAGLSEDLVLLRSFIRIQCTAGFGAQGIGLNSTTTPASQPAGAYNLVFATTNQSIESAYADLAPLGYNYWQAMEISDGTNSQTFNGATYMSFNGLIRM